MADTPLNRMALANARRRMRRAEELCPHWDYENDGVGDVCCKELAAAERAVCVARAKLEGVD